MVKATQKERGLKSILIDKKVHKKIAQEALKRDITIKELVEEKLLAKPQEHG